MRGIGKFLSLVALLSLPSVAQAADAALPMKAPPAPLDPGWMVVLGAEVRVGPKWVGASTDDLRVFPYPYLNFYKAGTPEPFIGPRDGFGIPIFSFSGFQMGPVAQFVWERKVHGFDKVKFTAELGGFVNYYAAPWLRARAEVRAGIGGHNGVVGDLSLDAIFPVSNQLTWSGGPRVRIASTAAVSPYFSDYGFHAKGGVQSVGGGTQLRYKWTPEWATHAFVEYERLLGDTANSPIVRWRGSPDQWTFGAGATYTFNWKGWN